MEPHDPPPERAAPLATERPEGVGEEVWIEVIRKMDEVYSDLLQYEVALEEKNAALEESQQFVHSVLASMSDLVLVCDRSGAIEDTNVALVEFAATPPERLRGLSILDLLADDASRAMVQRDVLDAPGATVHDREVQFRTAEGGAVAFSLACTPRRSAGGKAVGWVVTARRVGELRRAYEALRQAHDDLQRTQQQLLQSEKMASLGRLVAGVAHELNNPISFILGNVHALQRYATRLASYLEAVHAGPAAASLGELREKLRIDRILEDLGPLVAGTIEGAERTRDIVDGLKRFSAVDRGENTRFNLVEVIQRAVHWVTKATPDRFRVELDLPASLAVSGSAGQMQQVMMNLIQNAHDITDGLAHPTLSIAADVEGGRVALRVRDNGPGIDPRHVPHVFDPFFTTKPVGKGMGLGLAISYGIVERHGGRLSVANHPDGGAEFTLVLPLVDEASAARGDAA
jgi:two-component system, NtrC family, sensor histidine kinase HupT/HoxJ